MARGQIYSPHTADHVFRSCRHMVHLDYRNSQKQLRAVACALNCFPRAFTASVLEPRSRPVGSRNRDAPGSAGSRGPTPIESGKKRADPIGPPFASSAFELN